MEINGFRLIAEQVILEINTHARFFRHIKTGAELLSLENDDENKVFGITFRTPPNDSTGLPHILEHSVLAGSEKYPLKEPFVELLKGSMKTFLNAMTYPDKTSYPVASTNLKDFYNLIDVYVDAVMHPLISRHTLAQEGWHYELRDLDEPLRYKGVVFNEMKGVYSSPDNVLYRHSQQSLFPDTVYGEDSGGDPAMIPELTYEVFKQFHARYYHPSNARIFFYGDDEPDQRLRLMDGYLAGFDHLKVDSSIPLQAAFDTPRRVTQPYDAGENQQAQKAMLTVNWLLPEVEDLQSVLAFTILSHILVGMPASPLRKALLDSGLGEDLTGAGHVSHLRQMYFSTGLKGIDPQNTAAVEKLVLDTMASLARDGIDRETVAAALNTIEFRLRENNTGAFPRGLLLMFRALSGWLYGYDPIAPLAFEQPLKAIKNLAKPGERYFERLIEQYFVQNSHRTTVVLRPESGLRQREDEAERERLDRARQGMSDDQIAAIIVQTDQLKRLQETPDTPEALATLPGLRLGDLDRETKLIPLEEDQYSSVNLLYHDLFTNGVLYLDLGFNLRSLPPALLPYTMLFGRALTEMGTASESFVQLSQRIGRTTGGIRPVTFTSMHRSRARGEAWLLLRGKALTAQSPQLLAILRDILLSGRLDDKERFRQIVLEEKAETEAALAPAGNAVVDTRLRALFDEAGWADEQIAGVDYLFFLRELIQLIDQDWDRVQRDLAQVREHLVNRQAMLANVTVDAPHWQTFRPALQGLLDELPSRSFKRQAWSMSGRPRVEGLTIPAKVNYVGKGVPLYTNGYQLDGSILAIAKHVRTSWLWEKVRAQGGAYGTSFSFDHRSGVLTYLSYRDPNLLGTLEVYDRTPDYLQNLQLSQAEVVKSIIGAISDLDAYQLPDAKGYSSMLRYLTGESDESRQAMRDQLLDTSAADFRQFGVLLAQIAQDGAVVVLGGAQAIAAVNDDRPGWMQVRQVL